MDTAQLQRIMQQWHVIQRELVPELAEQFASLTPKSEKVAHILKWVHIEVYTETSSCGVGRPRFERACLANAFLAKAVLGLAMIVGLIERLPIDRALRRICGFPLYKGQPCAATNLRAVDQFAQASAGQRVHEALVTEPSGDQLIVHLRREGTAIEAREHPSQKERPAVTAATTGQSAQLSAAESPAQTTAPEVPAPARSRALPQRGKARPAAKASPIQRQREQTLAQMLDEIPTAGDRGRKCNAQVDQNSWRRYKKLHLHTGNCGVPITALPSSASMQDSLAAIPLSATSAKRVTNLYDLMEAASSTSNLREHSKTPGHLPLIDHEAQHATKVEFSSAEATRYHEPAADERSNTRLQDEFGANTLPVQGPAKAPDVRRPGAVR